MIFQEPFAEACKEGIGRWLAYLSFGFGEDFIGGFFSFTFQFGNCCSGDSRIFTYKIIFQLIHDQDDFLTHM